MKIIVVGTTFIDIKGFPLDTFIPTGRNAGRVEQVDGGVGRNIAESINSLGAETVFVSLIDHSGMSKDLLQHIKDVGINCDYVKETDDGLGTWLAVFDEHGDVCASISKRADLHPICDILDEYGDEIYKGATCVLPEIDMEEPLLDRIFDLAERHNVDVYSVISNMTIGSDRLEYIKRSKCFVCNLLEAGILFGEDAEALSPEVMLLLLKQKIKELQINSMVVTMGSEGCVYASLDGQEGFCPSQKISVVDTTGAGDAFFAGLSYALAEGKPLKDACELGSAVAAKVVQSLSNVYLRD